MALIEHGLVMYEYQPNSYEQYRHYVECKCGFQTRMGTEAAAKSQFDNHLVHHGKEPHYSSQSTAPGSDTRVSPVRGEKWSPFDKKVDVQRSPEWKPAFK
jgi:hypothetical protein